MVKSIYQEGGPLTRAARILRFAIQDTLERERAQGLQAVTSLRDALTGLQCSKEAHQARAVHQQAELQAARLAQVPPSLP